MQWAMDICHLLATGNNTNTNRHLVGVAAQPTTPP
jgi:hypothetical protein